MSASRTLTKTLQHNGVGRQSFAPCVIPQARQTSPAPPASYALGVDSIQLSEWAHQHYRSRLFNTGEPIRVRPGLLYFVERGIVRLESSSSSYDQDSKENTQDLQYPTFLGFVGVSRPFEIMENSPFAVNAYAHTANTCVFWMYWHELDNWLDIRQQILNEFRYQHQRQLVWLSVLAQKRAIDRLMGFFHLLVQEFGIHCHQGQYLPFTLTHTQIGSAIGATRVTVNRLMKDLYASGFISLQENNLLVLRNFSASKV